MPEGWYIKTTGPKLRPEVIEIGKEGCVAHITLRPFVSAMAPTTDEAVHTMKCVWLGLTFLGVAGTLADLGVALRTQDEAMVQRKLAKLLECALTLDATIMANISHEPPPDDGVGGSTTNNNSRN